MAGKGPSHRPEQAAELIRSVLAEALLRGEIRDPRVGMVTISGVEVTRDLSVATVKVLPHADDDAARDAAVEGLESAAGYLRRIVAKEMTTRSVPELRFVRDRGLEHAQRIDRLLEDIKRGEEPS
jgi:ribosome-binding factor A